MHSQDLDAIKNYYGRVLQSKDDLKTTACCSSESLPTYLAKLAAEIHEEVRSKFYGCGAPFPLALEGCTALDLGSGSGRDCFMLSKLVGAKGRVLGVDMTDAQLAVAERHRGHHAKIFGYERSNVTFLKGYIEDLRALDVADDSVDVVISNCVINLSPAKDRVFSEIFRVLKPGGELYFSDVFADRRLPLSMRDDQVLLGECLGGAMYFEDFRRLLLRLGCADFRVVAKTDLSITDPEIATKVAGAKFSSVTVRAFKLPLEDKCEDYGQVAYYRGGIAESPNAFMLDDHHLFEKNRPMLVCSNTADMLSKSRYGRYFEIQGNTEVHFGLFPCGPAVAPASNSTSGGCC